MNVKQESRSMSILYKVAGAMHQMGIVGLPRNYELVYEAMSGTRPELTRDFLALGDGRSQAALDELGRKYLPHHHEHDVLARSSSTVREELESFMRLVRHETSSLRYFGNLLDEASKTLTAAPRTEPAAVGDAVRTIAAATAQKISEGEEIVDEATEQSSRLEKVVGDLQAFEQRKYVDTLTGLANRRAFNRKLIELYEGDTPGLTGIAICDMDNFSAINQRHNTTVGDKFIRHVARIVERHVDGTFMAARTGGGQFGFIFDHTEEGGIVRLCEQIRVAVAMTPLVNALNNVSLGHTTLSFGICMQENAGDVASIVENATAAMRAAKSAGRNRTQVYASATARPARGNDWMLYRV